MTTTPDLTRLMCGHPSTTVHPPLASAPQHPPQLAPHPLLTAWRGMHTCRSLSMQGRCSDHQEKLKVRVRRVEKDWRGWEMQVPNHRRRQVPCKTARSMRIDLLMQRRASPLMMTPCMKLVTSSSLRTSCRSEQTCPPRATGITRATTTWLPAASLLLNRRDQIVYTTRKLAPTSPTSPISRQTAFLQGECLGYLCSIYLSFWVTLQI